MTKLLQESTRGVALTLNELQPFVTFWSVTVSGRTRFERCWRQLGSELLAQADVKWRRVALADHLQFVAW